MLKNEIQIGKKYVAKISNVLVLVKIEAEHKAGGWIATNLENNRQLRINNVRKIQREATSGETGEALEKSPPPENKKLTAQFAYETWRQNNAFPGLFILEQPENYIMFGRDAELTAGVLKRQKRLAKKSFTFSGKKKSEYMLHLRQPEIFGVMKNLALSGNMVLLVTQKKAAPGGDLEYEISKHIRAGSDKIIDGLPPREMVVKKGGQCAYDKPVVPKLKKSQTIQSIHIRPGERFKSQSGNEYHIQMVSESAVYAQQLRNGKPTGPTRPFDKKSLEAGLPKGLRGEDSYYPKSEALDAAEKVLQKASGPMTAKGMMLEIRKQKLWFTTARMPHTTLAAAIARDMKRNGQDSRFIRLDRGLFQLASKPAAKQPAKSTASRKTAKPKAVKKIVKKVSPKTTKKTPKKRK